MTSHHTIRRSIVLPLTAFFVIASFALPAAAEDVTRIYRNCKKIDKQIAHFRDVADMAKDRRDYRWFDSTKDHIQRLEARRPQLCPEQVAEEKRQYFRRGAKAARDLVRLASDAAIRYFTAGAY